MRCFYADKNRPRHTIIDEVKGKNPKFARFLKGISAEATQRTYGYKIPFVLGEDVDSFLSKSKAARKEILEDFIFQSNDKGESKSSTKLALTAIKSFLYDQEVDDGELFWRNLNKKIKTNGEPEEDEAPPPDVVKAFCETVSFRDRVITVVMSSSGIRVGGLVGLLVEDYQRLKGEGIGQLYVYSDDIEDKYMALISEEACDLIDRYLEMRKLHGERITGKSYLFRDIYDPSVELAVKNPQKVGSRALEDKFNKLWNKSGLRIATHNKVYTLKSLNTERKFSRYKYKSVHCFRKFFRTQLTSDRMPEAMIERLMGHGAGLVENYYRTGNPASEAWKALKEEYKRHMAALAIDEKYRRKSEIAQELAKQASEREAEVKNLKEQMSEMRRQQEADREEMRQLIKSYKRDILK
jgi:hypothetical protein